MYKQKKVHRRILHSFYMKGNLQLTITWTTASVQYFVEMPLLELLVCQLQIDRSSHTLKTKSDS